MTPINFFCKRSFYISTSQPSLERIMYPYFLWGNVQTILNPNSPKGGGVRPTTTMKPKNDVYLKDYLSLSV